MEEAMEAAERCHAELYAGDVRPEDSTVRCNLVGKVPVVDNDKAEKPLKRMKRGKAVGDDGITVDLPKDGRDIIEDKLAKLFSDCLRTLKIPLAYRKAIIILWRYDRA